MREWSGRAGRAPTGDHHVPYPALPSLPRVAILPRPRRSVGGAAPGPVATIRPWPPGGVGPRRAGVGCPTPHAQGRDSVGGWRLAAPPPLRSIRGNCATLTPPGRRVAGVPYWVPKPAASARARDPGLTLEGEPGRSLRGPLPPAAGPGERGAYVRPPAAEPSAAAPSRCRRQAVPGERKLSG
ncbi:hypothetical protein GQ602_007400 [Ophiocordyceps camponoti-floridani]|uniref:Uncharacterized protein n=1 Tax=Ophiocordyceps camponoti-floridani TaxID=2030778 RepID=A0A8H4VAJ2_9HYPO|nr:hypothetical protein GQ602_007400 [Ophiocordyceps camponoti-floridani]